MAWLRSCVAVLATVLLLAATGCGTSDPGPKTRQPQAAFDAAVASADRAWAAGDPKQAYEGYSAALKVQGARDTSGTVAAKADKAKRLMLSRELLSTAARDYRAVAQLVEVLQYASADSTEAASARSTIASIVGYSSRELGRETASLRKAIKSSGSASLPSSVALVQERVPVWRGQLGKVPGRASARAIAGVDTLLAAADQVEKGFGRKYADDALSELGKVDKMLDRVDRELDAFADGK